MCHPVPVAYHSFGGWKRSLFGDPARLRPGRGPLLHAQEGDHAALAERRRARGRRLLVPEREVVGLDTRSRSTLGSPSLPFVKRRFALGDRGPGRARARRAPVHVGGSDPDLVAVKESADAAPGGGAEGPPPRWRPRRGRRCRPARRLAPHEWQLRARLLGWSGLGSARGGAVRTSGQGVPGLQERTAGVLLREAGARGPDRQGAIASSPGRTSATTDKPAVGRGAGRREEPGQRRGRSHPGGNTSATTVFQEVSGLHDEEQRGRHARRPVRRQLRRHRRRELLVIDDATLAASLARALRSSRLLHDHRHVAEAPRQRRVAHSWFVVHGARRSRRRLWPCRRWWSRRWSPCRRRVPGASRIAVGAARAAAVEARRAGASRRRALREALLVRAAATGAASPSLAHDAALPRHALGGGCSARLLVAELVVLRREAAATPEPELQSSPVGRQWSSPDRSRGCRSCRGSSSIPRCILHASPVTVQSFADVHLPSKQPRPQQSCARVHDAVRLACVRAAEDAGLARHRLAPSAAAAVVRGAGRVRDLARRGAAAARSRGDGHASSDVARTAAALGALRARRAGRLTRRVACALAVGAGRRAAGRARRARLAVRGCRRSRRPPMFPPSQRFPQHSPEFPQVAPSAAQGAERGPAAVALALRWPRSRHPSQEVRSPRNPSRSSRPRVLLRPTRQPKEGSHDRSSAEGPARGCAAGSDLCDRCAATFFASPPLLVIVWSNVARTWSDDLALARQCGRAIEPQRALYEREKRRVHAASSASWARTGRSRMSSSRRRSSRSAAPPQLSR